LVPNEKGPGLIQSCVVKAVQAVTGSSLGNLPLLDSGEGRKLGIDAPSAKTQDIPLILTKDIRIFELWCLITKAQQLPYSDQSRADFLTQAYGKYLQILSEGHLSLYDFDTLQNNLAPTLDKELTELTLIAANADPSARLSGTQSLNVGHLNSNQFIWDVNFASGLKNNSHSYAKFNTQFMDVSKPVFDNHNSDLRTKSVYLDAQHSQYIASGANESITIGGDIFGKEPTNYNVVGMGGNDIFSIAADTLGDKSSVNLFGGGGKTPILFMARAHGLA